MWLFTKIGFYSATQYVDADSDPENPEIQVRARAREDLQNLIDHYFREGDDAEIIQWENRDYPYRLIMPQVRWVEIATALASDIDYTNFKDEVKRTQGEHRSHHYLQVWTSMYGLERKLEEAKRPSSRPRPYHAFPSDDWFDALRTRPPARKKLSKR